MGRIGEWWWRLGYRLRGAMFRWCSDEDGDVTLLVCGVLALTKYKEHTIVRWFPGDMDPALAFQGREGAISKEWR